jgi:hypothetical protein
MPINFLKISVYDEGKFERFVPFFLRNLSKSSVAVFWYSQSWQAILNLAESIPVKAWAS